jgi:hypothetical protein
MTTTITTPVERRSLTWRRLVVLAAAGDLVLLLAQGVAGRDREALLVAAAILVGAALQLSNTAFHPATLTTASGRVTVDLTNHDLFWHSFTVDQA